MKLSQITKIVLVSGLLSFSVAGQAASSTPLSDTAITAKVKGKIALDKTLSVFKVGVETNNHVVHLRGKLDSETQASTLVEIAESTNGVKDVDTTYLTIKNSSQPFTDSFITAKVKGRFVQEKLMGSNDVPLSSITVETNNGVVYLKGSATTQAEADNAVNIAKLVNGVKEVKSDIEVN
jgi:hyperosmotically inducible protein